MILLLTQSRVLVDTMPDILKETVQKIADNNRDATKEMIHVILGDAEGGDELIINLIDEINSKEPYLIPIEVYGGYGKLRRRTKSTCGKNIRLDCNYLARDKYMAKLCNECWYCWNGIFKNNTPGRSGTISTANSAAKLKKPIRGTYKQYNFRTKQAYS